MNKIYDQQQIFKPPHFVAKIACCKNLLDTQDGVSYKLHAEGEIFSIIVPVSQKESRVSVFTIIHRHQ